MSEIPDTADYQTALNILNKNILEIRTLLKNGNHEDKEQKKIDELKEYDINIEEPGYKISQVKEEDIYSRILPQLNIGKQILPPFHKDVVIYCSYASQCTFSMIYISNSIALKIITIEY